MFLLLYAGGQQIRKCVSDSSFTTLSQISTSCLDFPKCTRDHVRTYSSGISIALLGSRLVSPWLSNSRCSSYLSLQPISGCYAFGHLHDQCLPPLSPPTPPPPAVYISGPSWLFLLITSHSTLSLDLTPRKPPKSLPVLRGSHIMP